MRRSEGEIADFLSRGGQVLATGRGLCVFLPDSKNGRCRTGSSGALCYDAGGSKGRAGRGGKGFAGDNVRWSAMGPRFRVSQLCGKDAVVVSYIYGAGEAIWWSSPRPMSNRGLKDDASLKPSAGECREEQTDGYCSMSIFVESAHRYGTRRRGCRSRRSTWQCGAVALLLVLSFGRRSGPIRLPVRLPRSSPLEFAESMGRLYPKSRRDRSGGRWCTAAFAAIS